LVAALPKEADLMFDEHTVPAYVAEAPVARAEPSTDTALVLVVEDNPDMLRFVARTLGMYRIATACDGQEGLERACALRPDLVVTDVMMPRLSGDELVAELRGRDELDSMPILVLTAKADDELRIRLLGAGAQDYLAKPFSADELLARVRNLMAAKKTRDILRAELASTTNDIEHLAREVAQQKRELQASLEAARVARVHAEHASRAKTMFLGLVSHELATPLQSIRLNIDLLQRRSAGLPPGQAEKIDRVSRASNRLLEMIESLLEFVRLESGRLQVSREEVSLPEVAQLVVEDLRTQAQQKGLELRLDAPEEVPKTLVDARLLRLILINLVANSIKYTERGCVEVSISCDDKSHRIRVTDTGYGIPPEKLADIFEPFTQLESLRHKHSAGVGLGLALVRELTEAIGGEIGVSSQVGQGSTFTLDLPGHFPGG
jgi:signal transduction histidine kinase